MPRPPANLGRNAERDGSAASLRAVRFRYPSGTHDAVTVDELRIPVGQRVGVARALAQEPGLVLADEPVSNLYLATAQGVLDALCETTAAADATLVMSLHQPELARRFSDTIVGL